jgi:hypothetical protein
MQTYSCAVFSEKQHGASAFMILNLRSSALSSGLQRGFTQIFWIDAASCDALNLVPAPPGWEHDYELRITITITITNYENA